MLCFTSPTMRFDVFSWLMHSLSSTLKFAHCTVLVSWNSSIMMCSSIDPIFSKMKGESVSRISEWSSCCVSLSRNRPASSFSSRTLRSMLPRRRSSFMWRSVVRAVR